MTLVAPVRFLGKEPSVPIIIEFSVTEREKEQEVPPASFMKDKHLCLRIPFCDRFRFCKNLLIRPIRMTPGIVIEVTTIAVDDAYNRVARWQRTIFPERSFTVNRGDGAARKQKQCKRDAEYSPE